MEAAPGSPNPSINENDLIRRLAPLLFPRICFRRFNDIRGFLIRTACFCWSDVVEHG
jgi:hypothetical protein